MIRWFGISENKVVEAAQGPDRIMTVAAPDEKEKSLLSDRFNLDEYDMNSMLDQDEVPRLDPANGRLLVIWKLPVTGMVSDSLELGVKVVGLTLAKDQLAFVGSSVEVAFSEREFRCIADPRDAMLGFMLRTVRHFVGHLRFIKQLSAELEKKITVAMENKHLLQMFSLSESLVYYMDAIEGNAAVLLKLRNVASQSGFLPRQIETIDDIILENGQAARQANIYSNVLSGLMDARGTIVNNNMNVLLKNLTLINIVFLPLNLLASIGGMSEWTFMTSGIDWRISYGAFTAGMVVIGIGTWFLMKSIIDRIPPRVD